MMIREKWKEASSLSLLEAAFLMLGDDPDHHKDAFPSVAEHLENFNNHQMGYRVEEKIKTLFKAVKDNEIAIAPSSSPTAEIHNAKNIRIVTASFLLWLSKKVDYSEVVAGFSADLTSSNIEIEEYESATTEMPAQPWTETGLGRRERQIRIIEFLVGKFQFKCLSIPDGGKMKIGKECKESYTQFFGVGDDPFKEAWQEAVKQCRIRMEKHEQYSRE
jgi:hypothetical protein